MSNQVRELEKRIESLEKEVQLLMAQVRFTLLEVQEHLLNATYPALQSTDLNPTLDTYSEPTHSTRAEAPQTAIRRVSLDTMTLINDEPDLAPTQPTAPTTRATPPKAPAPAPADKPAPTLQSMDEWVLKKIRQFGADRTLRLISIYEQNGQLSQASASALTQLVGVYDDTPPAVRAKAEPSLPLPDTIRRGVETSGAPAHKKRQATATPEKPKRSESSSSAKPAATPAPKNTSTTNSTTQPMKVVKADEPHGEPTNMILRLIAGVQSAGIGGKRRSSNG